MTRLFRRARRSGSAVAGLALLALLWTAPVSSVAAGADPGAGTTVGLRTSPLVSHTTVVLSFRRMVTGTSPLVTISTELELPLVTLPAVGQVLVSGPFRVRLPLVAGSTQVGIPASLIPGHYTLTADFPGTVMAGPSRGSASFTVVKAPATLRITSSRPAPGSPTRLWISVSGGPVLPTGAVTVLCGHQRSGHVGLTRGRATMTIPAGTPLRDPGCRVTYFGDVRHVAAATSVTFPGAPAAAF